MPCKPSVLPNVGEKFFRPQLGVPVMRTWSKVSNCDLGALRIALVAGARLLLCPFLRRFREQNLAVSLFSCMIGVFDVTLVLNCFYLE